MRFVSRLLQKTSSLSNLEALSLYVIEEAKVPGYELYLVGSTEDPDWLELAFQQEGQDASLTETQNNRVPPRTIPRQVRDILTDWVQRYPGIHVMSHNPRYLKTYTTLLRRLGFSLTLEPDLVDGLQVYTIH